jgi:hypothetical protein
MPPNRGRNKNGTYEKFAYKRTIGELNPSSKIVHEEMEIFFSKVQERLDGELPEGESQEAIRDVREAVIARFGSSVAKSCLSTARGRSGFNGFQSDNHKVIEERLMSMLGQGEICELF